MELTWRRLVFVADGGPRDVISERSADDMGHNLKT